MKNLDLYNRFFSFGCSFTEYHWPTWADIMGQDIPQFQNWGIRGGGNKFILNSLLECHQRNKINSRDLVMVMWSTISREDRFIKGRWVLNGNVYRSHDHFGKEFLLRCVDIDGYLLETCNYISAARQILDKIGCEYYFLSMIDIKQDPQRTVHGISGNAMERQIFSLYADTLDTILPSIHEVIFDFDWLKYNNNIRYRLEFLSEGASAKVGPDFHPTPLQHCEYLQKVFPDLNLSQHALDFARHWEHTLRTPTQEILQKLENRSLYTTKTPSIRFGLI